MKKIGFIGMGNMAQAILKGFISSGHMAKEDIYSYDPVQDKLKENADKYGFTMCKSLKELAENVDTFLIACKPYQVEGVLSELGCGINGKSLISIALGWDFEKYEKYLDKSVRMQFIMPNTPAMVGEGVFLFEETNSLENKEREQIIEIFSAMGVVKELPSNLMGIGGAVTGCGPAFVDLMIEALSDVAVKYGIQRDMSYEMVSQMILGTAKLQLETKEHPGVLKDRVCSPAGTTICGVTAMEEAGFRNACIKAVEAVMNKN